MTLGSPIEIGKRYRLNIRPNPEYCTPCCGLNIGETLLEVHPEVQGMVVNVIRPAASTLLCQGKKVQGCGKTTRTPEGLYLVASASDDSFRCAVPYTWFEPLEEDDDIRT